MSNSKPKVEDWDWDDGKPRPRKSIFDIPCFWSAMSSGSSGGIIAGVVYYLGTSNVRKMHHIVMGSFITFSLGAWTYCRIQRSNTFEMMGKNQQVLQDIESNTS